MATMIGERVLPDSVNSARRRVRNRVMELRQPIRTTREDLIPGPDLIGRAESQVMNLRDRFMTRDGVLSRIRSQQQNSTSQTSSGGSSANTPQT